MKKFYHSRLPGALNYSELDAIMNALGDMNYNTEGREQSTNIEDRRPKGWLRNMNDPASIEHMLLDMQNELDRQDEMQQAMDDGYVQPRTRPTSPAPIMPHQRPRGM